MSDSCDLFQVIVLTGLSGAGKSTALNVFEDLRFFTVDGLPPRLLARFVRMFMAEARRDYQGLVVGLDVRHADFVPGYVKALEAMKHDNIGHQTMFIEARTGALIKRYAATRRPHPLSGADLGLEQAIEAERGLLMPLRDGADLVIDTSDYSVHDFRRVLQDKWTTMRDEGGKLRVHLITFGFKHSTPAEADMIFDLRFLPNPYFVEDLRSLDGRDPAVASYVLDNDTGGAFLDKLSGFLEYLLPQYAQEGRYRVTVGIGCTGGKHRSVAVAEAVHKRLKEKGFSVSLEHRHVHHH